MTMTKEDRVHRWWWVVLGWAVCGLAWAAPVTVEDPWVKAAPPTARTLAAYLVLRNDGTRPWALVGVSSPDFERAMLHESRIENGMARMRHVTRLQVPPGETVRLAPGGYHLMLMGPRRPLPPGAVVELVLTWEDGSRTRVRAPVRRGHGAGGHRH